MLIALGTGASDAESGLRKVAAADCTGGGYSCAGWATAGLEEFGRWPSTLAEGSVGYRDDFASGAGHGGCEGSAEATDGYDGGWPGREGPGARTLGHGCPT
jgi:hypothetical protein